MNHTATYLDSGFYTVTDAAANALVSVIGHSLPKAGWEKFVKLEVDGKRFTALLQRTATSFAARRWQWAIYAIKLDAPSDPFTGRDRLSLGHAFDFLPVANSKVN